jgi:O-antigen ligase
MIYTSPIDRIYQYCIIASIFMLPLTVLGNNIFIWLTAIIWLFSGNYQNKIKAIYENQLAIASILFFLIHVFGLLWTENIGWGFEMLRKMLTFFFILPIFLTICKKENRQFYLLAFFTAIGISELLSYLVWFEVLEPFGKATIFEPTPVMGHISYNPFLAFAIYLVGHEILFQQNLSKIHRIIYTFFLISMTFNMFITGGRAGQVMFFIALILLVFQYFKESQFKATIAAILIVSLIALAGFNYSPIFKNRIQQISYDLAVFTTNPNTSVGHRVIFAQNTMEMIKASPIFGVGTGDYPFEYKKINQLRSPDVKGTVHPHNMYLFVQAQLGLVGLIGLLWIFATQFRFALQSREVFVRHAGVALPLLFMVIMLSDSYLLGHYTSNLFILFSSFLYNKY